MASLSSTAQYIWNYLRGQGLTPAATAGVMGNLMQESSLNPNAPGGGLAQWIGSRQVALDNYAVHIGESPNSLDAQLGYLMQELRSGQYGSISALNSQPTPAQAAMYFEQNFEKAGVPMMQNRVNYADQFYQQFTGSTAGMTLGPYYSGSGSQEFNDVFSTNTVQFFQQIDEALAMPGFDITNPFGSIMQDGRAFAFRAFLFLIGLIIMVFGLIIIVKNTGITSATQQQ